jgi:hypothetical protein
MLAAFKRNSIVLTKQASSCSRMSLHFIQQILSLEERPIKLLMNLAKWLISSKRKNLLGPPKAR